MDIRLYDPRVESNRLSQPVTILPDLMVNRIEKVMTLTEQANSFQFAQTRIRPLRKTAPD
jgi:hypothetical protein